MKKKKKKLLFIIIIIIIIQYYYHYYYYYYYYYLYTWSKIHTFVLCMMHDFARHVSPTLYRIPIRVLFEELYMIKLILHAMSSLDQYHP